MEGNKLLRIFLHLFANNALYILRKTLLLINTALRTSNASCSV
jgi:hypothetical protein